LINKWCSFLEKKEKRGQRVRNRNNHRKGSITSKGAEVVGIFSSLTKGTVNPPKTKTVNKTLMAVVARKISLKRRKNKESTKSKQQSRYQWKKPVFIRSWQRIS
jgi:hypothetical protein